MATESTPQPPHTTTPPTTPGEAQQPTHGVGAAHKTTDRLASTAHETVDRLAERGGQAEERLRASGHRAAEQSREYYGEINGYIREHPYTALGVAAAAGFLIGSLLRR